MVRTITLIQAAMRYATFEQKDVKLALDNLLEITDRDLADAGFEPSARGERAEDELEEALNAVDETDEKIEGVIKSAAVDLEDDENGA